jgi:hypothetical protein
MVPIVAWSVPMCAGRPMRPPTAPYRLPAAGLGGCCCCLGGGGGGGAELPAERRATGKSIPGGVDRSNPVKNTCLII